MFAIIGLLIVFGGVIGGFVMHGGPIPVLIQPSEFVIMAGAAIGSLLVMSPLKTIKAMVPQMMKVFGSGPSKKHFLDLLVMMYEIFNVARKDGLVGLESHIEKPFESSILKKYPAFLKDHHAVHFFSDTMRVIITGAISAQDLEALMDLDLDTHHEEQAKPAESIQTVADSMPGFGIVAAVLGIVVTMGAIGGPPEEIGEKVAAALIGTFLGILLCYGFFQPIAKNIQALNEEGGKYYACLKQGMLGFQKGFAASIAVEFARRAIFASSRPTFEEVENACRQTRAK
ncbi:MAG: flagellar motor stator protein MotA [candidate division Zixibacteria bacterium]|nr:flagellar motor stator protein MotA [candidate division Zixibacteria bacterium]